MQKPPPICYSLGTRAPYHPDTYIFDPLPTVLNTIFWMPDHTLFGRYTGPKWIQVLQIDPQTWVSPPFDTNWGYLATVRVTFDTPSMLYTITFEDTGPPPIALWTILPTPYSGPKDWLLTTYTPWISTPPGYTGSPQARLSSA